MIEGLKLDFKSADLVKQVLDRAEHHLKRAGFYAQQAQGLEQGQAEAMGYSGGDPVKALKDKAQDHKRRAEILTIMAEHIVPDETYRLDEADLVKLELISRYF